MGKKEKVAQPPEQIWKTARTSIGLVIILTVVSVAVNMLGADFMFVFSNYLSLIIGVAARELVLEGDTVTMVVALVVSLLVLLPYALGYFQTKKSGGWMVAVLVMWCIDTVISVVILDIFGILFHALGIWELARAVKVRNEVFAPKQPVACPRCGAPVPDGSSFCNSCGAEIPSPVATAVPEQPNF